jgi:hypothetical protein
MTEDSKITLSNDFRINYEEQIKKIKKNGVIMCFTPNFFNFNLYL